MFDVDKLDWNKMNNLIPTIVQDWIDNKILMLGYMSKESLSRTLETKKVTFFSRSKGRLWTKGETSGNVLNLVSISSDCDNDALLIKATPIGPTCHTGEPSCFGEKPNSIGFLNQLNETIIDRFTNQPENSYTTSLFREGVARMAQKVGEEGVEVAISALGEDNQAFEDECADLLFHLLVLARSKGIGLNDIAVTLSSRHSSK